MIQGDYTIGFKRNSPRIYKIRITGSDHEKIIQAYHSYVSRYIEERWKDEHQKTLKIWKRNPDLQGFIVEMTRQLLTFIYEIIEQGRRSAFREMYLTCKESKSKEDFRQRILDYLTTEKVSSVSFEDILKAEKGGLSVAVQVYKLTSIDKVSVLRGQTSRYLEFFYDHPGLRLLRAMSEMLIEGRVNRAVKEDLLASVDFARDKFRISTEEVAGALSDLMNEINLKGQGELREDLILHLVKNWKEKDFARWLYKKLPPELKYIPAWKIVDKLREKCESIL